MSEDDNLWCHYSGMPSPLAYGQKETIRDIMTEEDYIGKETTIDFGGDLRMSQPWRSYKSDEIFIITKKTKAGLYMVKDTKGKEHPISKRCINYFRQK